MRKKLGVLVTLFVLLCSLNIKASAQGVITTRNYSNGIVDHFRMDAVEPDHLTGDYINNLLSRYPGSRLYGYGDYILQSANEYGVNASAFLGIVSRETTFGKAACGGEYNFGCVMYAPWMDAFGITATPTYNDDGTLNRYWATPQSVEQGIDMTMYLIRHYYIDRGIAHYGNFVDKYAPGNENNHYEVKSLFYGTLEALGQNINETFVKTPGGGNMASGNVGDILPPITPPIRLNETTGQLETVTQEIVPMNYQVMVDGDYLVYNSPELRPDHIVAYFTHQGVTDAVILNGDIQGEYGQVRLIEVVLYFEDQTYQQTVLQVVLADANPMQGEYTLADADRVILYTDPYFDATHILNAHPEAKSVNVVTPLSTSVQPYGTVERVGISLDGGESFYAYLVRVY